MKACREWNAQDNFISVMSKYEISCAVRSYHSNYFRVCDAVDNVYHLFRDVGSLDIMHNVQFVKIYKVVHSGTVSKLYFNKNFF